MLSKRYVYTLLFIVALININTLQSTTPLKIEGSTKTLQSIPTPKVSSLLSSKNTTDSSENLSKNAVLLSNLSLTNVDELDSFLVEYKGTKIPLHMVPNLYLNLEKNKLTELPDSLKNLKNLIELDLSNNQLMSLPNSLDQLIHLKKLNLSNNKLISLDENIGNLLRLKELDLSHNSLFSLPDSIGKLSDIQHLNLANNKFFRLPNSLSNLLNLERIRLSKNRFPQKNILPILQLLSIFSNLPLLNYIELDKSIYKTLKLLMKYNTSIFRRLRFANYDQLPLPLQQYLSPMSQWQPEMAPVLARDGYSYLDLSSLGLQNLIDVSNLEVKNLMKEPTTVDSIDTFENLFINLNNNYLVDIPDEIKLLKFKKSNVSGKIPCLTGINLSNNKHLKNIDNLKFLSLKNLSLAYCHALDKTAFFQTLTAFKDSLETLNLDFNHFSDAELQQLVDILSTFSKLHTLIIPIEYLLVRVNVNGIERTINSFKVNLSKKSGTTLQHLLA